MQEKKEIDWCHHISEQKSSGGTQREYCEAHHLNIHTFTYHKQKIEGKVKKPKQESFVPVTIKPQKLGDRYDYEICEGSINLKISKGFDINEVKELMRLMTLS